jgi:hypothetical protein
MLLKNYLIDRKDGSRRIVVEMFRFQSIFSVEENAPVSTYPNANGNAANQTSGNPPGAEAEKISQRWNRLSIVGKERDGIILCAKIATDPLVSGNRT